MSYCPQVDRGSGHPRLSPEAKIVAVEALREWRRLQHHQPASGSIVSHNLV